MTNFTSNRRKILLFFVSITVFIIAVSCTSTQEPAPVTEPQAVQAEKQPEPAEPAKYTVSDEIYSKTFSDIEALIEKLNQIIKASNFTEWKKYLTKEYIEFYSSQENLKLVSDTPTLKKYKIVLRSLNDYFTYVVVPSRSDVQLDDISFIDDNNVKAYMQIDGEPVVLYTLINIDGNWKIGQ